MRAVQSELYKIFAHHPKIPCSIDSKNRRSCKKCRFDKCIESGMKISYVKSLEEKCQKILQTQKTLSPIKFTDNFCEKSKLETLSLLKSDCWNKDVFKVYDSIPNLFMQHFCKCDMSFTAKAIEDSEKIDLELVKANALCHLKIDCVTNDATTLVKHNFYRFIVFLNAVTFARKYFRNQDIIHFGMKHRSESREIDGMLKLVESLGFKENPKVTYEHIYSSPWASNWEIEQEHAYLYTVSF